MPRISKTANDITTARALLGAPRIIAFLRAARNTDHCIAVCIANHYLDVGKDLDQIFREGKLPGDNSRTRRGAYIKAKRVSTNKYLVDFGCHAGPTAGDGGQWLVTYDASGAVASIVQKSSWIS